MKPNKIKCMLGCIAHHKSKIFDVGGTKNVEYHYFTSLSKKLNTALDNAIRHKNTSNVTNITKANCNIRRVAKSG